jgi:hypothetical protein
MQRVPELPAGDLTLRPLAAGSRTATSSSTAPARERWVIRLAGNDTHLLGISREVEHAATVAAAGVGVGPEVTAFIRPEGYLVTRFIEGSPVATRRSTGRDARPVADSLRRIHDGPADPGPVRAAPDRRGVPGAGARPRRRDPARVRAGRGDRRRIELALLTNPSSCGRATTTC